MSATSRAYAVWAVGLSIYLLAVFHRSSLAVAGLVAAERFHISAAQLATFTMLQLLVYAVLQIPVGLLIDRYGPRTVVLAGTSVIVLGQVLFALAQNYPVALLARALVGIGDAMTFVCVLRMVIAWFPGRRVPLMSQLTGTLGQLGGVLAAVPMTWALGTVGWTTAYLLTAAASLLMAGVGLVVLADSPLARHAHGPQLSLARVRASLADSWSHPGTRLGFWMHFVTQFSVTCLSLLWGYPFFVRGEGRTPTEAGFLLSLMVVVIMVAGPVLGWLVGRHPWHRSTIVLTVTASIVAAWTLVLAWPGPAPVPLLVLLVVVVAVGGPASMIGFDMGRTSNPADRLGSATGIINQGGFYATLVLVLAIGLVLDWRTPGGGSDFTPSAFRWAMAVQYPLWALGLVQVWRYRIRTRRAVSRDELDEVLRRLA